MTARAQLEGRIFLPLWKVAQLHFDNRDPWQCQICLAFTDSIFYKLESGFVKYFHWSTILLLFQTGLYINAFCTLFNKRVKQRWLILTNLTLIGVPCLPAQTDRQARVLEIAHRVRWGSSMDSGCFQNRKIAQEAFCHQLLWVFPFYSYLARIWRRGPCEGWVLYFWQGQVFESARYPKKLPEHNFSESAVQNFSVHLVTWSNVKPARWTILTMVIVH